MSTLIKMVAVLVTLNMFMYLGISFAISTDNKELNKNYNFRFTGDLMDTLLSGNDNIENVIRDTKTNFTNYGTGMNGNFTLKPEKEKNLNSLGITIIDALDAVWAFILTLCNIIVAPLTLFFNFDMPIFIGLIIGVPYFIILAFTLFAFIRGVSD